MKLATVQLILTLKVWSWL
ncbi:hypothetical protein Golax_002653, partial [Gossypium laxum]|nr:hypothetical protein [Gossypium laxum]MBA0726855.1 hypothetical protein [Gossypium laxum]